MVKLQLTAYTGLPKNILGYVGFGASTLPTGKIVLKLQLTAYTGLPKNILGYVGFRASTRPTGKIVLKKAYPKNHPSTNCIYRTT